MTKYNIGDRVRVIDNINPFLTMEQLKIEKGYVGTVIGFRSNTKYSIVAKLDKREGILTFAECEIESVNKFNVELL